MIRYLSRAQAREGDTIRRTWGQLAKGLGLATGGLTIRQARDRYGNVMRRTISYLTAWGYLEGYEALYEPNGEGRCIVVRLHAGVAQSVRATRIPARRRHQDTPQRRGPGDHGRATGPRFFSGKVSPPRGGLQGDGDSKGSNTRTSTAVGARERTPSTRERALASTYCRAALAAASLELGSEGTGARFLEVRPELARLPLDVVAREAWRLFAGQGSDPRLSLRMAERLNRADEQISRAGYGPLPPGAGASRAAAIDLALGDWREHWPPPRPPRTLGGLAVCLRRLAHRLVTQQRARRA